MNNMLTRGYIIGQIIDELSAFAQKVKSRGTVHLFDINTHCENFFRDLLNLVLGWKLENLNGEHMNAPGVDLADISRRIGVQITSTADTNKVYGTLKKTDSKKYSKVYIFVVGQKQGRYRRDATLTQLFEEIHIWDVHDLLKQIMDLELQPLQEVLDYVQANCRRVRIEMEAPDKDGKYENDLNDYVEKIPAARISGFASFIKYHTSRPKHWEATEEELSADYAVLIKRLKRLPRITRQFFCLIVERGQSKRGEIFILDNFLKRICNWPEKDGELQLLSDEGFISYDNGDGFEFPARWHVYENSDMRVANQFSDLKKFAAAEGIPLSRILVGLDFSSLA